MKNGDRRLLPPMAMLHSFEAAARLGSFSAAADLLSLTQSAVSRQIAHLEEWLGIELFDRRGRRIALNAHGRRYLGEVAPGLQMIRRATARLIDPPQERVIDIACLPGFGMRWLAPRLPRLTARHADLVVNLTSRTDVFDLAAEPFDAAIHVGAADWPEAHHDLLFAETVVPVVAPDKAMAIREPADFLKLPLLTQSARRDAWTRWFAGQGIAARPDQAQASFSHFLMLAQAVAAGAGAALLPTFLIEGELAEGRLVAPLDLPLAEQRSYFLVHSAERPPTPAFVAFRQWMLDEARGEGGR